MMRISFCLIALLSLDLSSTVNAFQTAGIPTTTPSQATPLRDGLHDFDFLHGHWKIHNRRLAKRLADSHDWATFEASDDFHALPGDMGNEENWRTAYWKNFVALGLQLYNPQSAQWSLYWVDNHNTPGLFSPPVSGTFSNGVGTFYATDSFNGKPIRVRILWKRLDMDKVRWEQAFSIDHGRSWETNWTMDFMR